MIPQEEWLHEAQRLPLGQSRRVYHGAERRPNMAVYNNADGWSCWCHACHAGGRVKKEFPQLLPTAPEMRSGTGLPSDRVPLTEVGERVVERIVRYLAPRGLDFETHIRPLGPQYTEKYDRLLLPQQGGALVGRALGDQPAKCIVYSSGKHPLLAMHPSDSIKPGCDLVLFEDYLSTLKAREALGGAYTCVSIQGTSPARAARAELMQASTATLMLDGDKAGYEATPKVAAMLRALGVHVRTVRTPEGQDPKNLKNAEIRGLVHAK